MQAEHIVLIRKDLAFLISQVDAGLECQVQQYCQLLMHEFLTFYILETHLLLPGCQVACVVPAFIKMLKYVCPSVYLSIGVDVLHQAGGLKP